jgi:hypothetical protein
MAYRNPFTSLATAALLSAAPLLLSGQALAGYVPLGDQESLSEVYPGKAYSPYAERSFPSRVFWGDTPHQSPHFIQRRKHPRRFDVGALIRRTVA